MMPACIQSFLNTRSTAVGNLSNPRHQLSLRSDERRQGVSYFFSRCVGVAAVPAPRALDSPVCPSRLELRSKVAQRRDRVTRAVSCLARSLLPSVSKTFPLPLL